MQKKNDFTKGGIPGLVTKLALPMMGAQIVNALYSIVDRIYIGKMPQEGTMALSGVGITFPFIMLVSAFSMLAGMGGAPLCSIARGKGNNDEAEKIMGASMAFLLALGAALTVLFLSVRGPALRFLGARDQIYDYALEYITVYLTGSIFVMITLGMNPFINSQGFTVIGMITVSLGAAVNIALDPILMFTMNMGIRGAALATVISQAASAVWVICFLTGKKCILRLKKENIRLTPCLVKRIAMLGASNCTMNITDSIVSAVCNQTLALFSPTYLSVMTVISSVRQVLMMPMTGFGQGMQPVMGYNYGAGRYDRVKKCFQFTTLVCAAYASMVCAVTLLFPEFFIRLFNSDSELLKLGVPAMRVYYCLFFMMFMQMAGQYAFVALGMSGRAIFFSLLRKAFIVAPAAYLLPRLTLLGAMGVFVAEPISDCLGSTACFVTFMITVWPRLNHKVKEMKA